jgi:hypothetical protein
MSLKMIAASTRPRYRLMGWSVTSHASAGVRQISKNSCSARMARNSAVVEEGSGLEDQSIKGVKSQGARDMPGR